mgnify:CR=1 FL=1
MPTLTCYTCKHDGRCGMTSSPKQCGLYEPQAKALDQGKGEKNEKDYNDRAAAVDACRCSGA